MFCLLNSFLIFKALQYQAISNAKEQSQNAVTKAIATELSSKYKAINLTTIRYLMFDQHYEVLLADTPKSKAIHYGIRYQVYCEEMGFENKADFPQEQEFDHYDDHAAHFIVRTKQDGQWVGAMRMVFKNDQLLPLEKHCALTTQISNNHLNRSIEISRLCLIKSIRKRSLDYINTLALADEKKPAKDDNVIPFHPKKRLEQSIIWGLIRAGALHCEKHNIYNCYFFVSNALAKILYKHGFNLQQIGEPFQFNGERLPFEITISEVMANSLWHHDFKQHYIRHSELEALETSDLKKLSF